MVRTLVIGAHFAAALLCASAAYAVRLGDDMWWAWAFSLGFVYFLFAGLFGDHG